MSCDDFVCRVLALAPTRVFSTPPRSSCCGCQLPLTYDCAQETSVKEMIGGGQRIGWLAVPWTVGVFGSLFVCKFVFWLE
ncbi:transcription initiation factor TFIID subunit 12-like [Pyrus ussuriensis x Pyrus communis]|uniref:Transcription initiation factor TFIID subunit 12-like n=1 Tax=Pyrus ussuriensis x Pyrus communis TaxID=2448454 RepID=A0A5N5FKG3_9ROSA|nr:transcription initiation factor TFIID subunit 12-like [Pyrus ussuriensis x Pyrus communis]